MKITLRDIAKIAGVSVATVSNAISGKKGVSAVNRERIRSIAQNLGYTITKNPSKSRNNEYIQLIIYKRSDYGFSIMDMEFFMDVMHAITDECQANDIALMVSTVKSDEVANLIQIIQGATADDCAGVLLLATEMKETEILPFLSCAPKMVVLDNEFPQLPITSVATDNEQAGRLAAQHLLDNGHRDVMYLDSRYPISNTYARKTGFMDVMSKAGYPVDLSESWAVTPTIEDAFRDMDQLLTERGVPAFSACFAFNDIVAIGCARAFRKHGLQIPSDISIVGMDDLQLSRLNGQNLTTIRVHKRSMATAAVRTLLDLMNEDSVLGALRTRVGVDLVVRGSVKKITVHGRKDVPKSASDSRTDAF